MHELSICQNIMEIIERQYSKPEVHKITDLWLEIGAMSCIEPESLEYCFEVSCRNTPAQGCKLHFIFIPMLAWCRQCKQNVEIQPHDRACPNCGEPQVELQSGNELRIQQIAVA